MDKVKYQLFLIILVTFLISFSQESHAEYLSSTLSCQLCGFEEPHCTENKCTEEVRYNLFTGSDYTNCFLLIPIIMGIAVDLIGALNMFRIVTITYTVGSFFAGICAILTDTQDGLYFRYTFIQVGNFFIGTSYVPLRVTIVVLFANICLQKKSIQNIKSFVKAFTFAVLAMEISFSIPGFIFNTFSIEKQYVYFVVFVFNLLAVFLSAKTTKIQEEIQQEEDAVLAETAPPEMMVGSSNVRPGSNDISNPFLAQKNTFMDRNDPDILNHHIKMFMNFIQENGFIVFVCLFGLGYLRGANDFIWQVGMQMKERGAIDSTLFSLPPISIVLIAILYNCVNWTKTKAYGVTLFTLALLGGFQIYQFIQDDMFDLNQVVLMVFASLYLPFSWLGSTLTVLYVAEFDMHNLGKYVGIVRWCASFYGLSYQFFYGQWYLFIAFIVAFSLFIKFGKPIRRSLKKLDPQGKMNMINNEI